MTTKPAEEIASSRTSVESLTFADVLQILFEHRRLIVIITLAGLILGAVYVAFFGPLYRSEAVLNLRNVSFAEYKRYSPALNDRERFMEYAARTNNFSEAQLAKIRTLVAGSDALGAWIHPLFTMTKSDVKDVAEIPKDANLFTGADIVVAMNSNELARKLVVVCGDYVRAYIMAGRIEDFVTPSLANFTTELTAKQLDILRSRFDLERLSERRNKLQAIATTYRRAEVEPRQRQVISTQDGGERYLSPTTQVIGLEVQIVELDSEVVRLERDVDRLGVLVEYFKTARRNLDNARFGDQMATLDLALAELKQKRDLRSIGARDAVGTIESDLEQLRAYETGYMRFASAPTSRSQIRSILVWAPVVLATLIAFLCSLLIAIARAWWRFNRSVVLVKHT